MARRKKHDPNKCFGCRLHALIQELYPDGPRNSGELQEALYTLANCSADLLQCTDKDGVRHFLSAVMVKVMENEENQPSIH